MKLLNCHNHRLPNWRGASGDALTSNLSMDDSEVSDESASLRSALCSLSSWSSSRWLIDCKYSRLRAAVRVRVDL